MNKTRFYSEIRPMFGKALTDSHVQNISGILEAFEEVGDADLDTLAYCLATVYHETGKTMRPVREGFAKTDAGARRAVANLAAKRGPNSAPSRYGKSAGPYGHAYYGRGYPQLTWLDNYKKASADAGVDLVRDPDAMLIPRISARVLIRGIMKGSWNGSGHGLDYYEGSDEFLDDKEAAEARRTVNVQDKALTIARYHRQFYNALVSASKSLPTQTVVIQDSPGIQKPQNIITRFWNKFNVQQGSRK